ncbi:hypothetical protein [Microcoleus sp. MON2_D5]
MKNLTKWKLLRSRFVLNNQWCQVRQDEIELPSGQIIDQYGSVKAQIVVN